MGAKHLRHRGFAPIAAQTPVFSPDCIQSVPIHSRPNTPHFDGPAPVAGFARRNDMKNALMKTSMLLLPTLLLAACGGGSGGGAVAVTTTPTTSTTTSTTYLGVAAGGGHTVAIKKDGTS